MTKWVVGLWTLWSQHFVATIKDSSNRRRCNMCLLLPRVAVFGQEQFFDTPRFINSNCRNTSETHLVLCLSAPPRAVHHPTRVILRYGLVGITHTCVSTFPRRSESSHLRSYCCSQSSRRGLRYCTGLIVQQQLSDAPAIRKDEMVTELGLAPSWGTNHLLAQRPGSDIHPTIQLSPSYPSQRVARGCHRPYKYSRLYMYVF
ncbi:hypothetical protein EDB86DRAFT_2938558 [Lactarius hatsudake]|nr:hypothetical protein EDB86DRAFT_2938558 [Lactarius hatsudake]